jgi:hypothetical protein
MRGVIRPAYLDRRRGRPENGLLREEAVFDLSDKIIEQIVFAMEDQERKTVVDLETGEVLPASGRKDGHYADPPSWSSRDGFKLMEDFLSSVRQPSPVVNCPQPWGGAAACSRRSKRF